jgi:hypothetical protein
MSQDADPELWHLVHSLFTSDGNSTAAGSAAVCVCMDTAARELGDESALWEREAAPGAAYACAAAGNGDPQRTTRCMDATHGLACLRRVRRL